jgi:hypothetical protein
MSDPDWNPTSKTGWPVVEYDQNIWIPCPPGFPEGVDQQSWATAFARAWWNAATPGHDESVVELLADMLAAIHEGSYGHIPCHLVWIHLPDPRLVPLPVYLGVWESLGDRDTQLRMLAGASAPRVVEPPMIEEFVTDTMGSGLRGMRYQHDVDDGSLYATLSYAWRSDQFDTDVQLWASCADLGRLHRAIPDIELFAQAIRVMARDQLPEE